MALADRQHVSALSAFRRHSPPTRWRAVGGSELAALFSSPGTLSGQQVGVVARLRGATERFGSVVAHDDPDLEIRRGEFVALLAPTAPAKTTAIDLLLELRAPSSAGPPPGSSTNRSPVSVARLAGYRLPFIAIAAWATAAKRDGRSARRKCTEGGQP